MILISDLRQEKKKTHTLKVFITHLKIRLINKSSSITIYLSVDEKAFVAWTVSAMGQGHYCKVIPMWFPI